MRETSWTHKSLIGIARKNQPNVEGNGLSTDLSLLSNIVSCCSAHIFRHIAQTNWPCLVSTFVSEYVTTTAVFVNSHPWLVPGWIGDLYGMTRGEQDVREWGRPLLRYHDRRFLKDQMFCLFVFNTPEWHFNNLQENSFFLLWRQILWKEPTHNWGT